MGTGLRDEEPSGHQGRRRLLDAAYELFSTRGIQAVGTNEIIERAGVAKATLYSHFRSKNDLVLAFLERRDQVWTKEWIEREARRRAATPEKQLVAIFDLLDEWFRSPDFEGCSFVNVLLELESEHPAGEASIRYLENIRSVARTLAEEAGLHDPKAFALAWHIVMNGAIVQASEGVPDTARRAKRILRRLIEDHRPRRKATSGAGGRKDAPSGDETRASAATRSARPVAPTPVDTSP